MSTSFLEIKREALEGNVAYQVLLGDFFLKRGNNKEARSWYQKASEAGSKEAFWGLGKIDEMEFAPNYTSAIRNYSKAAELGSAEALNALKRLDDSGVDAAGLQVVVLLEKTAKTQEEKNKIFNWYEKAARRGNATAQMWLGRMYHQGDFVQKNETLAHQWHALYATGEGDAEEHQKVIDTDPSLMLFPFKSVDPADGLNKLNIQEVKYLLRYTQNALSPSAGSQDDVMAEWQRSIQTFPLHLQLRPAGQSTTEPTAPRLISQIKSFATGRTHTEYIDSGSYTLHKLGDFSVSVPVYSCWQDSTDEKHNFLFSFTEASRDEAYRQMNRLLFNMLLSQPIKQIHLNLVDLNLTHAAKMFTANIDQQIYSELIVSESAESRLIQSLREHMSQLAEECDDLVEYNKKNEGRTIPYEVVVLMDYHLQARRFHDEWLPLMQNGYKEGIYFIVMNQADFVPEARYEEPVTFKNVDSFTEYNDFTHVLPTEEAKIIYAPIIENLYFRQRLFSYINDEARRVEDDVILKQRLQELALQEYVPLFSKLELPVGEDSKGIVYAAFDTSKSVHSFVLGQTGSGKSVFLHNIILNALIQYQPEDLQLYLFDFKLGGVEFNRYKGNKHVKALLVDGSDAQITLEILRDLYKQMKARGKRMADAGFNDIGAYNKKFPENRLPQILLIADECQMFFQDATTGMRKIQQETEKILTRIATEGRSQGVHLLMATQTLSDTNIPPKILNNITDFYLLKCSETDANRLIDRGEKKTKDLKTGFVFSHNKEGVERTFRAYYAEKSDLAKLFELLSRKEESHKDNGNYYFSGSQKIFFDANAFRYNKKCGKDLVAIPGKSITLSQDALRMPLRNDVAENVLVGGIDDVGQVTRTSLDVLLSLIVSAERNRLPVRFCVINCLDFTNETTEGGAVLDYLSSHRLVNVIDGPQRGEFLYQLALDIKNKTAPPTVLTILAQERFLELKFDNPIERTDEKETAASAFDANLAQLENLSFSASAKQTDDFSSYRKALQYILENGPTHNVHVVMQINKPSNFMFADYVNAKMMYKAFTHVVMLRSDEQAESTLNFDDDKKLTLLSNSPDRLRAWYFNAVSVKYQLFSPFILPNEGTIAQLINQSQK